jgi:hypothetical protein
MKRDHETEALTITDQLGHPLVTARVPKIQRRFRSALHDIASIPYRFAGWESELQYFLAGHAPLARLVEDGHDPEAAADLRRSVLDALEQGFGGGVATDVTGATTGRIAIPDGIADTVDLAALRHDWLWWLDAAGVLTEDARTAIAWGVDELERRSYECYLWSLPVLKTRDIAEAIQYGVVVGDDPAMTCAAVLRRLTGERRFWEDLG